MALPDNLYSMTLDETVEAHHSRDRQIAMLQDEKRSIKHVIEQLEMGVARPLPEGPTQTISPAGAIGNLKIGVPGE